ncbi:MAG: hypothetical protein N3A66_06575, partial [Planctomycetota bacterium]|nr:hypothetical protein [Planctomycetota bacterium]
RLSLRRSALQGEEGGALPLECLDASLPQLPIPAGEFPLEICVTIPRQTHPGRYAGTIALAAGAARSEVKIGLEVASAFLAVDRPEIDFGCLNPGQGSERTVALMLEAPRPLNLTWRISGNLPIEIFGHMPGQPLNPDAGGALRLRYRPRLDAQAGARQGEIVFKCGPAEARLTLRCNIRPPAVEEIPDPRYLVLIPEKPRPEPEPLPPAPEEPPAPPALPAKGEEASTARAAPTAPAIARVEEEVWRGLQPYVFWALFLLLLLAILVAIIVRAMVRERLLRYGVLSLLAHAIIALLTAHYLVLTRPTRLWVERPRLLANLVSIKESVGLELSAAERVLLQRVRQAAEEERRFAAAAEEAEARRAEAARTAAMEKIALAKVELALRRSHLPADLVKPDEPLRAPYPEPAKPPLALSAPKPPLPKEKPQEEAKRTPVVAPPEMPEISRAAPAMAAEERATLPLPEMLPDRQETKTALRLQAAPARRQAEMPSPPPLILPDQPSPTTEAKKDSAEEVQRLVWREAAAATPPKPTAQPMAIAAAAPEADEVGAILDKPALASASALALPLRLAPAAESAHQPAKPALPAASSSSRPTVKGASAKAEARRLAATPSMATAERKPLPRLAEAADSQPSASSPPLLDAW